VKNNKLYISTIIPTIFACSGAQPEDSSDNSPANKSQFVEGYEPPVYLPGEDPEQVDLDTLDMLATIPVSDGPIVQQMYDSHLFDAPPPDNAGQTDKSSLTMLQGWSINGNLHFEDGLHSSGEVGADHCSSAGLNCDYEWHLQANDIYIDTFTDFFGTDDAGGDFMGACGSYMQGTQYYPCINRFASHLTGGHSFKWKLNDVNCGDATQKSHIRAGIIQGLSNFANAANPGTGVTFSETSGSNWNYAFSCGNLAYDQGGGQSMAWTQPSGNLALRFGAPRKDGLPVDWIDECETPGLPGVDAHRPGNPTKAKQASDMQYTYSRSEIVFEDAVIFGTYATCMTTGAQFRRGIGNILMHELGHDWGYQHSIGYTNATLDALNSIVTCASDRDNVKILHPYIRYAIADQDTIPDNPDDVIWDNDISCFDESGWSIAAPDTTKNPQP
jgi:hypothetical protein